MAMANALLAGFFSWCHNRMAELFFALLITKIWAYFGPFLFYSIMVITPDFDSGNSGSIPDRATNKKNN